MKNLEQHQQYLKELSELLSGERIGEIDFDRLTQWLGEANSLIGTASIASDESHRFREDYIGRIAGMIKAITVANRKQQNLQSVLDYIEHLSHLNAADLIAEYQKTQARFRDSFPASFGPRPGRNYSSQERNFTDFK